MVNYIIINILCLLSTFSLKGKLEQSDKSMICMKLCINISMQVLEVQRNSVDLIIFLEFHILIH